MLCERSSSSCSFLLSRHFGVKGLGSIRISHLFSVPAFAFNFWVSEGRAGLSEVEKRFENIHKLRVYFSVAAEADRGFLDRL